MFLYTSVLEQNKYYYLNNNSNEIYRILIMYNTF